MERPAKRGPRRIREAHPVIRAAVVGGAGYTGIETVRLLLGHPDFEVTVVTSAAEAGRSLELPGSAGSLFGKDRWAWRAPGSLDLSGSHPKMDGVP